MKWGSGVINYYFMDPSARGRKWGKCVRETFDYLETSSFGFLREKFKGRGEEKFGFGFKSGTKTLSRVQKSGSRPGRWHLLGLGKF